MRTAMVACVALVVLAGCANTTSGVKTPSTVAIARENMTLHFAGYASHAQLTYPATGGRHPVVVLIPGSGPEDLNAAICEPTGRVLSHNFADIATYLSARGYAVLRYDKRGVTGACKGSSSYTLSQLLADAGKVLAAAEHAPHVDAHRVFVYGWSEGSTVAAALVLAHPEVSGLIVQGGVVAPWASIFEYQTLHVGVPYLRSDAPDGRIDSAVLERAATGGGGGVAKDLVHEIAYHPPGAPSGKLTIRPGLDTNHDGVLELNTELIPKVPRSVASLLSPAGPLHIYGPGQALPVLSDQAPKLTLPTLILQGRNDANVPPGGATTFYRALAAKDKTLKVYPGLGHSLGPASSATTDNFAPIARAPLANLITWLDAHH